MTIDADKLRALAGEYRPTMDKDVLHSWGQDASHAILAQADRIALLEGVLREALCFHEAEAKSISKQPPNADLKWRKMQHDEQISELRQALGSDT